MRFNIFKSIISLAVLICLVAVAGTVTVRADAEVMYAVDGADFNPSSLHKLNATTGALVETIGPIGFDFVTGIAFHPTTGVLYGVTSGSEFSFGGDLITIDLNTGAGTLIGFHNALISDIAFDSTGTLYAWVFAIVFPFTCCDALYTIDLTSGALSFVGTDDSIFTPGDFGGTGLAFD